MKIYIAHPITGLTPPEVIGYFEGTKKRLQELGFEVFQPMTAKGYFRAKNSEFGNTEKEYAAEGYPFPPSMNHSIAERDKWMVSHVDVVLIDLTAAKDKSIGCMMELAWGQILGKHTVVVMEQENVHRHAFVLEAADIVWQTFEEAMQYLQMFANQEIGYLK